MPRATYARGKTYIRELPIAVQARINVLQREGHFANRSDIILTAIREFTMRWCVSLDIPQAVIDEEIRKVTNELEARKSKAKQSGS